MFDGKQADSPIGRATPPTPSRPMPAASWRASSQVAAGNPGHVILRCAHGSTALMESQLHLGHPGGRSRRAARPGGHRPAAAPPPIPTIWPSPCVRILDTKVPQGWSILPIPVSVARYEFAQEALRLAGLKAPLEPIRYRGAAGPPPPGGRRSPRWIRAGSPSSPASCPDHGRRRWWTTSSETS